MRHTSNHGKSGFLYPIVFTMVIRKDSFQWEVGCFSWCGWRCARRSSRVARDWHYVRDHL